MCACAQTYTHIREFDPEMPQLQTADQPMSLRGRQGFSYRSAVGARGLLNLGEKKIWIIKIGKS